MDGVVVVPRIDARNIPDRSRWPDFAKDNSLRIVAQPLPAGADSISSTKLREAVAKAISAGYTLEAISSAAEEFMTPSAANIFAAWLVASMKG